MSVAVARGAPTPAQRYLDGELAGAAQPNTSLPNVSLPALLLHCLRRTPRRAFMINGATGEQISCQQILELAIPIARALASKGLQGRHVMALVRDDEHAAALYFGMMFAGAVPMLCDPAATTHEIVHYLTLVEPLVVFCERAASERVSAAVDRTITGAGAGTGPPVVLVDTDHLLQFVTGHSDYIDQFQVPEMEPDADILLLPTSGSTGLPKAAIHTNSALVMTLPGLWANHARFPTPTARAMILTTPQWSTFTILMTSCTVFQITLLMSPKVPTTQHVLEMMHTHRPTWAFFGPSFAKALADAATHDHFSSLETVLTLGSPASSDIVQALKDKMPPSGAVWDGYGMTELQGFVALSDPGAPENGNRLKVDNTMHYKLVKSDGTEAATDDEGELYIKSPSIIKGYVKQQEELAASMTADGWFRTGDQFHVDARRRLAFRRRLKFSFKYNNLLVAPEEVEGVISSVACVSECVVVASERGPGALVALRADAARDPAGAVQRVHRAVETTLSEHKRLRGGVALVAGGALPRTHTGKLHRARAADLFAALLRDGRARAP